MDKQTLRLASMLQQDSIVDGPGLRIVLWTQGCTHKCKNCHNPQTHDTTKGTLYDVEDLIKQIKQTKYQTGITFSGGEPFLQPAPLVTIAKAAKELHLNLWAYSGFTYEQLLEDNEQKELLSYLDVLVDGKYIDELNDYRLVFKGSKNQRIIDVQASLKEGKVIRSSYDQKNIDIEKASI